MPEPTDPNRLRPPPVKSLAFKQGWRACEAGRNVADNPYHTVDGEYFREWRAGFEARGDRGFSVDHLPRTPSGAFA